MGDRRGTSGPGRPVKVLQALTAIAGASDRTVRTYWQDEVQRARAAQFECEICKVTFAARRLVLTS